MSYIYGVRCVPFEKPLAKILSQKNAEIVNLKNPDLDLIRRIHPECEFYGFLIRFGFAKSVFEFGNQNLDFPKKTHPR